MQSPPEKGENKVIAIGPAGRFAPGSFARMAEGRLTGDRTCILLMN
ncbi:MAG: hypothetical protein ACE5JS_01685 [Nitrospinota bacterium]